MASQKIGTRTAAAGFRFTAGGRPCILLRITQKQPDPKGKTSLTAKAPGRHNHNLEPFGAAIQASQKAVTHLNNSVKKIRASRCPMPKRSFGNTVI